MNGENYHVLHASALDRYPLEARPRLTWTLFAAKLWLLAAFVGMSLVAVAVKLFLAGEAQPAVALASGLIGAILAAIAWRRMAELLERAERESTDAPSSQPEPASAPGRVTSAKTLLLAPHR
jgi:hypothetical protein